eukprot:PhM_4_TR8043/c0_g1_i1/m.106620
MGGKLLLSAGAALRGRRHRKHSVLLAKLTTPQEHIQSPGRDCFFLLKMSPFGAADDADASERSRPHMVHLCCEALLAVPHRHDHGDDDWSIAPQASVFGARHDLHSVRREKFVKPHVEQAQSDALCEPPAGGPVRRSATTGSARFSVTGRTSPQVAHSDCVPSFGVAHAAHSHGIVLTGEYGCVTGLLSKLPNMDSIGTDPVVGLTSRGFVHAKHSPRKGKLQNPQCEQFQLDSAADDVVVTLLCSLSSTARIVSVRAWATASLGADFPHEKHSLRNAMFAAPHSHAHIPFWSWVCVDWEASKTGVRSDAHPTHALVLASFEVPQMQIQGPSSARPLFKSSWPSAPSRGFGAAQLKHTVRKLKFTLAHFWHDQSPSRSSFGRGAAVDSAASDGDDPARA